MQISTAGECKLTSKMLQQLYLPKRSLGQDLLAEDIGDLLDGDALVGLGVDGGTVRRGRRDDTISPGALVATIR